MLSKNTMYLLPIFILLLISMAGTAKQDTLVVYELATGQESYYPLPPYDTSIVADSMPAYGGILGVTLMPSSPPLDTFPGTRISRLIKAADYYDDFNFPFTAVTLIHAGFRIVGGVVGPRAILVSGYDIWSGPATKTWRILTNINPLFDNATIHYGSSKLTPVRYYIPSRKGVADYAIIEVAENIGSFGGYFGFAFDTSSTYTFNGEKMLYQLSYPLNNYNPYPPSGYYPDTVNGDTMYMKYGFTGMDVGGQNSLDFGYGANGEYVAPYFDDNYQIRAMRWSDRVNPLVTPSIFYFLKYALSMIPTAINEVDEGNLRIYPNPASGQVFCEMSESLQNGELQIINPEGKIFSVVHSINERKFDVDVSSLPSGIYFLLLKDQQKKLVRKFIKE